MKLLPILTEKTIGLYSEKNKVTFEIDLNSNKSEANKEFKRVFNIEPVESNVHNRLGKMKLDRKGRRFVKKSKDKKIVVFTLNKGDKLDIFETNK